MDPLRIHVAQLGHGYIAESTDPVVTALGTTATEAAENARSMAILVLNAQGRSTPTTLIVRIEEAERDAIAMQSINKIFSLDAAASDLGSYYYDSARNSQAPADG